MIPKSLNLLCLLSLALSLGCSRDDEGRLPTEKVKVKLMYKDKPVEGATVTFMIMPTASQSPPPAYGITDTQGMANLTTYETGDGAVIGKHTVLIVKQEFTNQKDVASQDSAEYNPGMTPPPKTKHLLPQKYSLPTSGLTADIAKGKPLEFTFELKD
ncbi:MAG: hypothetical protein KGQ60_11305 [Planctomycetes bacterium]|nr:hypothetical protein [Planctomycetota bacterium]